MVLIALFPTTVTASPSATINKPDANLDDELEWIFDRHDLRHGQQLFNPPQDFLTHLMNLPDVRLDWPREFTRLPESEE